ncbi:hypothetical protein HDU93_000360, partial [Gonapodya sp. JEL0774]
MTDATDIEAKFAQMGIKAETPALRGAYVPPHLRSRPPSQNPLPTTGSGGWDGAPQSNGFQQGPKSGVGWGAPSNGSMSRGDSFHSNGSYSNNRGGGYDGGYGGDRKPWERSDSGLNRGGGGFGDRSRSMLNFQVDPNDEAQAGRSWVKPKNPREEKELFGDVNMNTGINF